MTTPCQPCRAAIADELRQRATESYALADRLHRDNRTHSNAEDGAA